MKVNPAINNKNRLYLLICLAIILPSALALGLQTLSQNQAVANTQPGETQLTGPGSAKRRITPLEAKRLRLARRWRTVPVEERQRRLWPLVREAARKHDLEPCLLMAVIDRESRFRPHAKSRKGALGLMQITPATARHLGLDDPLNLEDNLEAGARYLADLLEVFKGDIRLALAAYNAGPSRVLKDGCVPDIEETRGYVDVVLGSVDTYRRRFQALAKAS